MNHKKLIEILTILDESCVEEHKYIAAEHDILYIGGVPPEKMRPEQVMRLEELGAHWNEDLDSWSLWT